MDQATALAVPETPGRSTCKRLVMAAYVLACLVPLLNSGLYIRARCTAGVADGFPLDDAWIHAQYARTIAEGRPFEYVPGERSIGTTSVLFDLIWGSAAAVTGEYVRTAHVLNIVLTAAAAALLVAFLLRFDLPPLTAGFGAALIVGSHPFPWSSLSGMETALATCLTTAAVLAHVAWGRNRGGRMMVAPALMALAAIARPENLVLFPLSELDRLIRRWRDGETDNRRQAAAWFAGRVLMFGLILSPWFALNWTIHGSLFPHTFAAKMGKVSLMADLQANGLAALGHRLKVACVLVGRAFGFVWAEDNAAVLFPAALGALGLLAPSLHRARAAESTLPLMVFPGGVFAIGLVTLGLYFPCQAQRYLIQWIPMILIYGVVGMHVAARGASRLWPSRAKLAYAVVIGLMVLAGVAQLVDLHPRHARYYVTSVKNINEMQVALAEWIRKNTPPDAVIATNDIGAIAFFGERRIVDTVGLIDPEVVRRRRLPDSTAAMIEYLQRRRVSYAMLFPTWHPDLVLDPRFRPIDRILLTDNVVCGDNRMLVFEMDWDLKRQGPAPSWMADEYERCRECVRKNGVMR